MTRTTTAKPQKTAVTPTADCSQYKLSGTFTKMFEWINQLPIPGNHKWVLGFLIRICGPSGQASCGHEVIAQHFNMSVKTVGRAVANIEARQFVTVKRRYKYPNHYTIHPDILQASWPKRSTLGDTQG